MWNMQRPLLLHCAIHLLVSEACLFYFILRRYGPAGISQGLWDVSLFKLCLENRARKYSKLIAPGGKGVILVYC